MQHNLVASRPKGGSWWAAVRNCTTNWVKSWENWCLSRIANKSPPGYGLWAECYRTSRVIWGRSQLLSNEKQGRIAGETASIWSIPECNTLNVLIVFCWRMSLPRFYVKNLENSFSSMVMTFAAESIHHFIARLAYFNLAYAGWNGLWLLRECFLKGRVRLENG
jgi:hypothetical protein